MGAKKLSEETVRTVLDMSVASVLAIFGKRTDHIGYMYYSPFRDEKTPSMRVSRRDGREVWADFGGQAPAGKHADGGGILDMAMRLGGFTKAEALEYLAENYCPGAVQEVSGPSCVREKEYGNVVDQILPSFRRVALINYAVNERHIPRHILEKYCCELVYHVKSEPSRRYHAIGFAQNNGGYVLRGITGRYPKKSTRAGVTILDSNGEMNGGRSSDKGLMFEGFMDFMSWLAWVGRDVPGCDVCVLNSVNNVLMAGEWCMSHPKIACFFDNDDAGAACLERVEGLAPRSEVRDMSGAYRDSNDVNEKWCRVVSERESRGLKK